MWKGQCWHLRLRQLLPYLENIHHVGVCAEEDVQTGLIPVTVLILPGSNLQEVGSRC
jgi:hypothetical protein